MKTPHWVWAVVLVVAAVPVGFAFGAWIGGRFLLPDNAGLVGGAMVFWYGLLGLLLALVAGVVAMRTLDASRLRPVAIVVAGLAVVLLIAAVPTINEQRAERDAHRQQMIAMMPPFELVLAGRVGGEIERFAYDSYDNGLDDNGLDGNDLHVWLASGKRCRGPLPPGRTGDRSRVELLTALRGLDVAGVLVDPPACQQAGEALATLDMEIRESTPPYTVGRLALTQACRDEIPEIDALFENMQAVYRRHRRDLECQ